MNASLKKWFEELAKDKSLHIVLFDWVLQKEKQKKHNNEKMIFKPPEQKITTK